MHSLESRRGGLRALAVVFLMVGVAFAGLLWSTGDAEAQSPIYADPAESGYIERSDSSYPPSGPGAVHTGGLISIGQYYTGSTYRSLRCFLSFDTSALPDSAVVQQATLAVRVFSDASVTDFAVQAYESDYGTLDTGDWDDYHTFQGDLFNTGSTGPGQWHTMNLVPRSIDTTSTSQFMLKSSRDNTSTPTGYEYITLYDAGGASAPYLLVSYCVYGTTLTMFLTVSETYYNSTIYASVEDWNLTYERWQFQFDTHPDESCNVSIEIMESTWQYLSVVPETDNALTSQYLNLSYAWEDTTYLVWFAVPKTDPFSTVHLSLYNAFTGEGFFWESMRVSICEGTTWDSGTAETVGSSDFDVESGRNYTIRVLDYFGNALVDYSFSANARDVFVAVGVPYYSWQVFNMNDQPVLMKIYWEGAGAPWEFFVGPQWVIERNLKGGDYIFVVTFYDSVGIVGETVYFSRTVPANGLNASFIYVNGTTLTEIVSDIEGVQATQEIITSLVSPSMVYVYENLPLAPVSVRSLSLGESLAIDPYLVLEATTHQNDSGTDMALWLPHPDLTGATYYIMSDVLSFSGTYGTAYWVNESGGGVLYSGGSLPAALVLDGENITVETSAAASVSRTTTWREVSEYVVTYYPTQKKYQCTVSLNNTMGIDFYEPYWFIGFPLNTSIAQASVTVYDLDNSIYLAQTAHFIVTAGGTHLTLTRLNASDERNFRVTYYDYNSTDWIGAPNLIAYSYTTASYDGTPMKYTSVQWGNPWSIEYRGEIYITLNFTYGDALKSSSIKIVDHNTGRTLGVSDWVYTGRTIIILTSGVGTVPVGGGVNFGIYWTFDATQSEDRTDFFFGPIVYDAKLWYIGGFAISWALVVILLGWVAVGMAVYGQKKDWQALAIIWGCVTVILFLIQKQVG